MIVDRNHKNDVDLETADFALFKLMRTFEDKRGMDVAIVQPIATCSRTIASIVTSPSSTDVALLFLWLTDAKLAWIEPNVNPILSSGMLSVENRVHWLISNLKHNKSIEYLEYALDDLWNTSFTLHDQICQVSTSEDNEPILALERILRMFDTAYFSNMIRGPERVADLMSFLYRILNGIDVNDTQDRDTVSRLINRCEDILYRYEYSDCTVYESAIRNAYYDPYRISYLSSEAVDAIVADLKDVAFSALHIMRELFLDKSQQDIISHLKAPARKLGDITKDPFWVVLKDRYYKPAWTIPIAEPRDAQTDFDRLPGDADFDIYFDRFYIDPVTLDNGRNRRGAVWTTTLNAVRASVLAKNSARCQNYDITVVGASSADTVRVHFAHK